jgi:hypothetical protein
MTHRAHGEGQRLIHVRLAQQAGGNPGTKLFRDRHHFGPGMPGTLADEQRHFLSTVEDRCGGVQVFGARGLH